MLQSHPKIQFPKTENPPGSVHRTFQGILMGSIISCELFQLFICHEENDVPRSKS